MKIFGFGRLLCLCLRCCSCLHHLAPFEVGYDIARSSHHIIKKPKPINRPLRAASFRRLCRAGRRWLGCRGAQVVRADASREANIRPNLQHGASGDLNGSSLGSAGLCYVARSRAIDASCSGPAALTVIGSDCRCPAQGVAIGLFIGLGSQYDVTARNSVCVKPVVFARGNGCAEVIVGGVCSADQQCPATGNLVSNYARFGLTQFQFSQFAGRSFSRCS